MSDDVMMARQLGWRPSNIDTFTPRVVVEREAREWLRVYALNVNAFSPNSGINAERRAKRHVRDGAGAAGKPVRKIVKRKNSKK